MPSISTLKYDLNGMKYFSKVDIRDAFLTIELDDESKNLTIFSTPWGLYRYKRLNMGLCVASELFQETLTSKLAGLKNVKVAMDDILVFGRTQAEHDEALEALLKRLVELNLTVGEAKCEFSKTEITFYGMIISKDGIRPKKQKLEDFMAASIPKTTKEVKSFLSLAQYFHERIPNLSNIGAPLKILMKKFQDYFWGPAQQKAFELIKSSILLCCLGHFDMNRETEVWVDAGPNGIASYIIQSDKDGRNRTLITCGSYAFSNAERNYSQVEKEGFASVWACEHFHIYVYGQQFKLFTDNKSMVYILEAKAETKKRTPLRLVHWKARLVRYNFEAIHVAGDENIADYLSRCLDLQSFNSPSTELHAQAAEEVEILCSDSIRKLASESISIADILSETKKDVILQLLAKQITSKEQKLNEALKDYKKILSELSLSADGLITRGDRILLPSSLQAKAISAAHAGHGLGIVSIKRMLRAKYSFLHMDKLVEKWIADCHACNVNTDRTRQEPLKATVSPAEKWDEVDVDFTSRTPTGDYALVAVCERSRYPVLQITKRLTSLAAISALKIIFAKLGVPRVIKTDNGPAFIGSEFRRFAKSTGFKHRLITPIWPPANGTAERFMRNINKVIRCASVANLSWKACVNDYLLNYRNTPHSMTGCTPNSLMNLSDDSGLYSINKQKQNVDAFSKMKMKEYTDAKRHATPHSFVIGDTVVLKWSRSSKYQTLFDPDCYTVSAIDHSMITATRHNHQVTRNSSFFQTAKSFAVGSVPRVSSGIQQFPNRTYSFPSSALDTPFSAGPEQRQFVFEDQAPASHLPQNPTSSHTAQQQQTPVILPAAQQPQALMLQPDSQQQQVSASPSAAHQSNAPERFGTGQPPSPIAKKRKLQVDRQMAADNQARVALYPNLTLRTRNIPKT